MMTEVYSIWGQELTIASKPAAPSCFFAIPPTSPLPVFHLTHATLVVHKENQKEWKGNAYLYALMGEQETIICPLSEKNNHVGLDYSFHVDESGPLFGIRIDNEKNDQTKISVHISGSVSVSVDDESDDEDDEEGVYSDEGDLDIDHLIGPDDDDEDDDDEEDGDGMDRAALTKFIAQQIMNGKKRKPSLQIEELKNQNDEDEDDDESDDDNVDMDEFLNESGDDDDDEDDEEEPVPQPKKKQQPAQSTPGKKMKTETTPAPKNTPQSTKAQQQAQQKQPMKDTKDNEPKKRVSARGGVTYLDEKIGTGPEAKNGSNVVIRYEGRLANGKIFDSNMPRGKPFKFNLGAGECIKGFDIGISGMRVGGRRNITIPPTMGYGKQGAPPSIPPNAVLNFTVEVLNA